MSATPGAGVGRGRLLLALAGVALLLVLALVWMLKADNLAPALLKYTGNALGLEITAGSASEYRLRGAPQLVVRQLVAREPGAAVPVLQADRLLISLPWSTLRARGKQLTATRIELDAPVLDLAAFQRWQAARPAGDTPMPTLVDGARIIDGIIVGPSWKMEDLDLELARLSPDQPVSAHVRGRYASDGLSAPLDLYVAMTRPATDAGLGVVGQAAVETAHWRLPSQLEFSAVFGISEGLLLDRAVLGASARYETATDSQRFALGLAGPMRIDATGFSMQRGYLAVRGSGALPTLDAAGVLRAGDTLLLDLEGSLAEWPHAWPALPAPIGQSGSPLPFTLNYLGATDFSDIASLRLQRDGTRFDGRFRLTSMLDWSTSGSTGSPLPPMTGSLTAPKLELSGALLEGVELELQDDSVPSQPPLP